MVVHGAFGACRVALLEGVDKHAVFVDRRQDASRQRQLAPAHQAHEAAQVAGDAVEPAVAAELLHAAVEAVVGAAVAVDVLRRGVTFQFIVQAAQLVQIFVTGLAGSFKGAAAFQQRHHGEERVGVFFAQFNDAAAAVRHQVRQAFSGQDLQRFAQWRAADLPGVGKSFFIDEFAGGECAVKDHRAQPGGHAIVQGRAAQGGWDRPWCGW